MKALRFISTVLAVCVVLLASVAMAQTEAIPAERGIVPGPAGCTITTVYLRGKQDAFGGGPDPRHPSPALQAFLAPLHPADYDVDQPNHAFGDSFPLCACETCSARLEILVRKTTQRDTFNNDDIIVGVAPFTGPRLVDGRIWNNDNPEPPKLLTYNLDPAKFAQLFCKMKPADRYLDVYIEDDTVVDYMKLTITHP